MNPETIKTATVVKHTGSHYLVSDLPDWSPVVCTLRGKLRLKGADTTNPVAVGDRVDYYNDGEGKGVIVNIHPRKNYIIRKSTNLSRQSHILAANIDQVFLIITVDFPKVKTEFIDRFLVTCEAYNIPATLLVNKCDLYNAEHFKYLEYLKTIYRSGAGYGILETSATSGLGINEIRELCKDKISLFAGVSGVGKSTLINALDGTLNLRTAEISDYHNQGKHTTTFYEIHPIGSGGFIIDAPGIKGFGLIEISKEELSHYFPEMLPRLDNCRFAPCTHTHEPGCAVKEAVESGDIMYDRYLSYLSMLEQEDKYR